jgi:RND family efflux transporter MFP subunit
MKLNWRHLGFAGGLAATLLASCGKELPRERANPDAAPAKSVRVACAEMRPMERALHVVGTLAAHDEATVAAQVAGQIEKTVVDLGDRVTTGQELALIDTASYDALARQAAANLAKAKASAANAAQSLKRVQELQKDKIASSSEYDQAVAESEQALAEVQAAQAAEGIAQLNLSRSRVKAPFDGAVAERVADSGDYVSVGTPIIRLVKTDPLRLRLDVPERESSAVRVGQRVQLTVEGDTNVHSGSITRVAPAIRQTDRMLAVEADVPNRGALRAGLFARARIIVDERDAGLSVPAGALAVFAGIEKVVVVQEGKALEKPVTTGRRGADWVEIVAGLSAGEAVVLEPGGLRTGQAVVIENMAGKLQTSKAKAGSSQ